MEGSVLSFEIPIRMKKCIEFRSGDLMAEDVTFFILALTQGHITCFLFVHSGTNKSSFCFHFLACFGCLVLVLRKSFFSGNSLPSLSLFF